MAHPAPGRRRWRRGRAHPAARATRASRPTAPCAVLAERLAGNGCSVVRIDLDGTGDSWGDSWDPDRVLAWRASLHEAAAFLGAVGTRSLVVAGVRFGATLALTEGADTGADRVVAGHPWYGAGPSYAR